MILRIGRFNFLDLNSVKSWRITMKDGSASCNESVCFEYVLDKDTIQVCIMGSIDEMCVGPYLMEFLSDGISLYLSDKREYLDLYEEAKRINSDDVASYWSKEVDHFHNFCLCFDCAEGNLEKPEDNCEHEMDGWCSACGRDKNVVHLSDCSGSKTKKDKLVRFCWTEYMRKNNIKDLPKIT